MNTWPNKLYLQEKESFQITLKYLNASFNYTDILMGSKLNIFNKSCVIWRQSQLHVCEAFLSLRIRARRPPVPNMPACFFLFSQKECYGYSDTPIDATTIHNHRPGQC